MSTNSNRLRLGFSLVELLVVISITALLLSVLMPSLSKARNKAKQVMCLASERSLGIGFGHYANDFKQVYPYARQARTPVSINSWALFGSANPSYPAATNAALVWWENLTPYVARMNSTQFRCGMNYGTIYPGYCWGINTSSGMIPENYGTAGGSDPFLFPATFIKPLKHDAVRQPSRTMLLGEIPNSAVTDAPWLTQLNDYGTQGSDSNSPFHSMQTTGWANRDWARWARVNHEFAWNSLMCDGSAKITAKATLINYVATSGITNSDGSRFWLNR